MGWMGWNSRLFCYKEVAMSAAASITRLVVLVTVIALGFAAGCVQDQAINRTDDSARTGAKLYSEGQFADAAGAYQKSIREDPRNYHAYYGLGQSYDQLGQYQQSIQAYKSGIQVMSTSLEGKEDLAFRMKLVDGAAAAIAKSADKNAELDALQKQQTGESYLMAAKIYRYSGDADSAMDFYNRGALLSPNDFYIQKDAGIYLEQLGQGKRAEPALRKAFALNPKDEQVIAALRRIGVVPGPSIKDQKDLAKPVVPQGPIPEVEFGKGKSAPAPTPAPSPAPGAEAQSPRD
jgi:tetratricopeptide (TPR) repeat protein